MQSEIVGIYKMSIEHAIKWNTIVYLDVESQELIFIRGAEGRADRGADRAADRGAEGRGAEGKADRAAEGRGAEGRY